MKVKSFSDEFPEVKLCSGVYFSDERGSLKKAIHGNEIHELIPDIKEVLCTSSNKNVVRGMHYQEKPFEIKKFITCIKGEILDVFIDIRKDSKTFGKHGEKILNEEDSLSLLIPEGFAHGFSTLSESSVVVYLQSGDFNPEFDKSINPLSLEIDWKVNDPVVSEKDRTAIKLQDF
tara:strand:- start:1036 stop:1560 length:525 start_codon:yes stop_codon:yes gene_type:complete